MESRLEGLEAMTRLIPEILERLGPQTLTPAHQKARHPYVKQLHEAIGKPYATIYEDLKLAFAVPRYQDRILQRRHGSRWYAGSECKWSVGRESDGRTWDQFPVPPERGGEDW